MTELDPKSVAGELYRRVQPDRFVAWVGSGLSQLLQEVDWPTLVKDLCVACGCAPPDGDGADELIDKAEECKQADEMAYHGVLIDRFADCDRTTRHAFLDIIAMRFRGYLTTNFDPYLERAVQRLDVGVQPELHVYPEPMPPGLLGSNPRPIYHLHGHPKGIREGRTRFVLARSEFEQAYRADGSLTGFLRSILTTERVLFVGCLLKEPAIEEMFRKIEQILTTAKDELGRDYRRERYILLASEQERYRREQAIGVGGASVEEEKALAELASQEDYESERLRAFGIEVIRYDPIDAKHSGLDDILSELRRLLGSGPRPTDIGPVEAQP